MKKTSITMDPVSQKLFKKYVTKLKKTNLSTMDLDMLATFCNILGLHNKAMEEINNSGIIIVSRNAKGIITSARNNPAIDTAIRTASAAKNLSKEFGFTPLSKIRIEEKIDPEIDAKDPGEEFLDE